MSSKEHMQLGWVVRWVLITPRATPRLGGAAVSCQYFPFSFTLALRAPGLRLGVNAPLPLRASSRGVLAGAPNTLSVSSVIHPQWSLVAHSSSIRQNEFGSFVVPAGRSAAVVEPRYAIWGRAMHPGPCDLLHLPKKLCRGGHLHPRISSSSAPCLFSCGKWIRAVSYVCH
jgi:hypothetical protein